MGRFTYRGNRTKEISFPLGGIGTGCVGLAGNGRLIDWEIYNKPSKGSFNGFTHFAVKAEADGAVLDARVCQGDLLPPYSGEGRNFGHGPRRENLAGVPHFREAVFEGAYPIARLALEDASFPGKLRLTAFNPFIPLGDRDSSIPAAFFEWEIANTAGRAADYTLAFSLSNPYGSGAARAGACGADGNLPSPDGSDLAGHRYRLRDGLHIMTLPCNPGDPESPEYGALTMATDAADVSFQRYWYRGNWFDGLDVFWQDFTRPAGLSDRAPGSGPSKQNDTATLAARCALAPGEMKKMRFVLSWHFPRCVNYWNAEKCGCGQDGCASSKPRTWKNHYATVFKDSQDSAAYALRNWDRLYAQTSLFRDALFSSTLPPEALDAVSANLSILKSPTCLRLTDGSFYGFEGCNCESGCCEGSCTHVWNYAYALPFLFPALERSMRDLDYRYNQREDGGMAFRLQLPLGRERSSFRPCADGQFGGVVKAYRDWKISGDTAWLAGNWEAIRKSIEFAWAPTNADRWDADRDGVLEGRQHHTLDMELFGPNPWLTGFYLAALKAGAEMAAAMGEPDRACEYRSLFERGRAWVEENLYNGEYYYQRIGLEDRSILAPYREQASGEKVEETYWNEEAGQLKYQVGEGCLTDQVLAQWHAGLCGLGDIFDPGRVRSALRSIYRHNFKRPMRDFFNPCRLYALGGEAGLVVCDWPAGRERPVNPAPYSQETWSGCEYQAAAHMIREGFFDEGMEIVKAVRARYDGERRNPWNEFECGSNYARSMASYALIPAMSGFKYDMTRGMMGFEPIAAGGFFRVFWSLEGGWGLFETDGGRAALRVLYGAVTLREFSLPSSFPAGPATALLDGRDTGGSAGGGAVRWAGGVTVAAGKCLEFRASAP